MSQNLCFSYPVHVFSSLVSVRARHDPSCKTRYRLDGDLTLRMMSWPSLLWCGPKLPICEWLDCIDHRSGLRAISDSKPSRKSFSVTSFASTCRIRARSAGMKTSSSSVEACNPRRLARRLDYVVLLRTLTASEYSMRTKLPLETRSTFLSHLDG